MVELSEQGEKGKAKRGRDVRFEVESSRRKKSEECMKERPTGAPISFQLGSSSSRAFVSITAPERM